MSEPDEFTVAWICALTTEFVAASALLDEEYPDIRTVSKHDDNNYKLGRFGQHRVVIAVLPRGEYGLASAAGVARDIMHTFRNLRFGLMVGIGGGAPTSKCPMRLGDVVVSQPIGGHGGVFQYDFGKAVQEQKFIHTGHLNQPPRLLLSAIARLSGDHELDGHKIQQNVTAALQLRPRLRKKYGKPAAETDRLYRSHVIHPNNTDVPCSELCSGNDTDMVLREDRSSEDDDPGVYYGLIASANSLMKDATVRDKFAQENSVLCFEMEAGGLMNQFPCLVIRGICDYADTHKNKAWQGYAAMTAAAYAKELMSRIAPEDVTSTPKLSELIEGIQTDIESIKDNTKAMADHTRMQSEQYTDSKHYSCLQCFKTSTYEAFKERNPPRIKGTCSWVLKHPRFIKWVSNPHSDLLWVSADPGCGKSVLAKALVDDSEFSVAPHATVCHFFFKDNEDQDNLPTALCALLHQLFSMKPQLLSHAMRDWETTGDKLRSETDTLWRILESAATDTRAGQVFCVLDALDECREQDRQRLIAFLCQFHSPTTSARSKTGSALKFVVTSRPYADQEQRFSQIPEIRLRGEDHNDELRKEISLVIEHRLQELKAEIQLSDSTWQRVKTKLLGMEHRTYLWFYLAIEDIRRTYRYSLRPEEEVIELIPTSVDDAYENILTRVSVQQQEEVRKVLGIILSARRPFSLDELSYAFGIAIAGETDDLEKVVIRRELRDWLRISCGLFVYFSDSKVYLIHQTAKEFLLDRENFRGHGWRGSFEITAINHLLGQACIYALFSKDFQDFEPGENYFLAAVDSLRNPKQTFLSYCAEYWTAHLNEAYDSLCDTIQDKIDFLHDPEGTPFAGWSSVIWNPWNPLLYIDESPTTIIHICSFTGHNRWLEQNLSSFDSRLEEIDARGRTALYWACFGGQQSTVRLLIRKGANVNAHSDEYGNALQVAVTKGYEEIARLLIDNGADVNAQHGIYGNVLQEASVRGYKEIARLLIDNGADTNAQDGIYGNPLQVASAKGHKEIVRLLIDNGADINAQGGEYGTALQAASAYGHEEIARLLLKAGAKLDWTESESEKSVLSRLVWGYVLKRRLIQREQRF